MGRKAGRRRLTAIVAVFCLCLGIGLGAGTGAVKVEEAPPVSTLSSTPTVPSTPPTSPAPKPAPSPRAPASTPTERTTPAAAQNVRGVYVVRHSLRSPTSVDGALARAGAVGANAVYLQVNGRGEAYYDSAVTVRAPDAAPDFDPLAYALERAREHGLAVHAWINAYTAGMLAETPDDPEHVLNRHPDWVTVDRAGRSLWDYPWQEAQIHVPARMLDPGLPEVEDYVVAMVLEVAEKYDVAGIHLDYVRYPSARFGFHPASAARFEEVHGFDPLTLVRDAPAFVARHGRPEFERRMDLWDRWRRDRVTALVARLGRELRSLRPEITFSVAVDPDPAVAVVERFQDWPRWIAEGLVDAVAPMAYSPDGDLVENRVAAAVDLAAGKGVPVHAALGAYMVAGEPEQLRRQMEGAERAGASGTILFSYDTLEESSATAAAVSALWTR